ncbi:hypothetical protein [Saccharibacillus deserti]|uniref:hypothetical protein n=1 Tax=Saccharibacillus deserti TaxID=1634444 RepID=UPI00155637BA|nr:hypothetical protein [Saccharibacillus deserti]
MTKRNKFVVPKTEPKFTKFVVIHGYDIEVSQLFEQSSIDQIMTGIAEEIKRIEKDKQAVESYTLKLNFILHGLLIREFTDIEGPEGYKEADIYPFATLLYNYGVVHRGDESLMSQLINEFPEDQLERYYAAFEELVNGAEARRIIQEKKWEEYRSKNPQKFSR